MQTLIQAPIFFTWSKTALGSLAMGDLLNINNDKENNLFDVKNQMEVIM